MDSFANFLPMFAAFNGLPKKTEGGSSDLAEFPDEVPSEKQLKDWLNEVDPIVRRTYGALLRGDTPAGLVSIKATAERDLTGYVELPMPVAGAPSLSAWTSPSCRAASLRPMVPRRSSLCETCVAL